MFEHHENDDFEEYIKERKKGTTETDVEQRIEERAKRRRGKLNGFLCFIAGMAVSFVLVYVGFVIALNKGGFTHIFTSGNGSKLDYKKIEEKLLVDSLIKPLYTDILNFVTDKNGATRKEIEEYINFSQTRVITLLKEMLELNLIRKEKDKIDRRSYKYYKK